MGQVRKILGLLKQSPTYAVRRISGALLRRAQRKYEIFTDYRTTTFYTDTEATLRPLFVLDAMGSSNMLVERYLAHEFNLLGSGWVCLDAKERIGTTTTANAAESQRIWAEIFHGPLAKDTYSPIDWQLDFKSGYRWAQGDHVSTIPYGHKEGVDIKVPWELSRLQHLPQLALAAQDDRGDDRGIVPEIRAQILDFIANNPPRFGVNWRCPMDIAIRVVNLVTTYSLLKKWDAPFETILANGIQAHVDYILSHLEWSEEARGNHYFANILGLLFGAATLPQTTRNKAILAFAIQEFFIEARRQFLVDGATFEGSTGYHRLSAEMLYWGCALILGLDGTVADYDAKAIRVRPPFPSGGLSVADDRIVLPDWIDEVCAKSVQFIQDTALPNGLSLKIGDYDSGRLLKICPPIGQDQEVILDHSSAVSIGQALFDPTDTIEGHIVAALSRQRFLPKPQRTCLVPKTQSFDLTAFDHKVTVIDVGVPKDIQLCAYPDFGLYIWKGSDFMLSVRCFSDQGLREWGHFHDDNLAVSLYANGKTVIVDPGTLSYTALPEIRKQYRNAGAHCVPRLEGHPAMNFGPSLFEASPVSSAQCICFEDSRFIGVLQGRDWQLARQIKFRSNGIEITDMSLSADKKLAADTLDFTIHDTDGYGQKSERTVYTL